MAKKIGMFVWNHFTNDARVLRECSSLAQDGYEVDLICIHDGRDSSMPRLEQRPEGFRVIRVSNESSLLGSVVKLKDALINNRWAMALAIVMTLLGLWFVPVVMIPLLVATFIIFLRQIQTIYLRACIILRMVRAGMASTYDIYHSNDLNTLPQGYLCARIFRRRKLVYDSHEVQTSRTGYNNPIYGIMERFFVKRVDVMIMENHTRAAYSEERYGFYPEVVHNYPVPMKPEESDAIDLYAMLDIPREEPILLYQGGVQMGRGLDKLVEAVPMFERGIVVFIGDGRIKPELQQRVQELGLEHRVKFMPKVPMEQLLHYTKNAYLGFQILNNVCFNHYSASSNKLFEYMMSSVPVVACSFPEIQRVVENEDIGVCVDSHDPRSIAEGVNYLLNNPDHYARMKANCLVARDRYNWDNEKHSLLKLYHRVSS
ncbi:glycosyltransferase [Paenibacillus kobensis]|uniref:glycosyltransferase n=1 Tax=Paenibacillus kobensis TaxID=59841 RepID=UPI001FEC9D4A|nr:glycosyltransferase [Paenibacillus kobensis]